MDKFETDDNRSYFISRLFVYEALLKEDEPKESRKGAEGKQVDVQKKGVLILCEIQLKM